MVICLERGADLHIAQLMSLPLSVSCFSKIQIGFTCLVPVHPGSPRKGPLNGCVCVYSLLYHIFQRLCRVCCTTVYSLCDVIMAVCVCVYSLCDVTGGCMYVCVSTIHSLMWQVAVCVCVCLFTLWCDRWLYVCVCVCSLCVVTGGCMYVCVSIHSVMWQVAVCVCVCVSVHSVM